MTKLKRIKKVRIHREGDKTLIGCGVIFVLVCALAYVLLPRVAFCLVLVACIIIYSGILNFFRCPIRRFQASTDGVVVAPADGKIVVDEEVEENEYFGDRRRMVYTPTGFLLTDMLPASNTRTATTTRHGFPRQVWKTSTQPL